MTTVLAVLVLALMVGLAVAMLTGRVRATGCCSVADPRRDARMRGAFTDPD